MTILPNIYADLANEILELFVTTYYTYDDWDRADDYYWIGETMPSFVPHTAQINDHFWNIEQMVLALKLSIPQHILFDWNDYSLDIAMYNDKNKKNKKHTVNLYNYFIWCPTNLDETQPNKD